MCPRGATGFGRKRPTYHKSTACEKSTGLGLAIVKRLVEGHRGKVWGRVKLVKAARSSYCYRAVMEILMSERTREPFADDGRAIAMLSAKPPAPRPLRILLAEDKPVNHLIACTCLSKTDTR